MIEVVGTMFFKDKKLLIDKPRKRNTYQMIGGKVEDGELPLEAVILFLMNVLKKFVIWQKNML